MFATLILIVLVLVAAVTDATRHRIYNWTTYPGILAGLALAFGGAAAEWLAPESAATWQPTVGWIGLGDALLGFAICGAVMIPCFVFFGAGGGDVKLLTMIGTLIGLQKGLEVLLWTFLLAGCIGLIVLIWKLGAWTLLVRCGQILLGVFTLGTVLRIPQTEKNVLRMPVVLAPCVPVALAMALLQWPLSL
jgi:prepilin peptidase CpaA